MKRAPALWLLALLAAAAAPAEECPELVIQGATLIRAPAAEPAKDTAIVLRDGRIAAIAEPPRAQRPGACTLEVAGRVVTAGLWNAHVHFSDPAFASPQEAAPLLRSMLLRYGFTSVVDAGSRPETTLALRRAIGAGRIDGPAIVMASGGFVYRGGTPAYLPEGLLPELARAEAAPAAVDAVLDRGAEGVKIFSGSFQGPGRTVLLPPEIIRAVTRAAHARDAFVMSHPTSREGLVNAVENGVDILAHTAPPAGRLEPELLGQMLERNVALVPTLMLWAHELRRSGAPEEAIAEFQDAGIQQLADYSGRGGEILFGTDVGYLPEHDPSAEYRLMHRAGLGFADLLRSLTTRPAARFERGEGRVRRGARADLVVFEADPRRDPAAFADVAYTIRGGRVVYRRAGLPAPSPGARAPAP